MRKSKKAPKEKVEFRNVFGEKYVPEEHELDFLFIDETPMEDLQEDVVWLAKDIIDHSKILDLYAERIYSVEEACFWVDWKNWLKKDVETLERNLAADAENMSTLIEVVGCMQEANKAMLELFKQQDKSIKNVTIWQIIITIWLAILTVVFWIYVL